MKNLSIVVAGTGEIKDISIKPGPTKVSDVIRDTGLSGYVLSRGADEKPFNQNDEIYTMVNDGQKIYATTPADAGR